MVAGTADIEHTAVANAVNEKLTAPGIPRRSPIQVLTRPDPAWLPRSDEIGHVQGGMAVSEGNPQKFPLYS